MSARVFCDGCGKELVRDKINLLQVATHTCKLASTLERYELCADCLETAKIYFNPTMWPRDVRARSHNAR